MIVTEVEALIRLLHFHLFMNTFAKFCRSTDNRICFMVISLCSPYPCSNKDIYFVVQLVLELKESDSPALLEEQNTKCHPGTNYEATPKSKIKELYPVTFCSSQVTLL